MFGDLAGLGLPDAGVTKKGGTAEAPEAKRIKLENVYFLETEEGLEHVYFLETEGGHIYDIAAVACPESENIRNPAGICIFSFWKMCISWKQRRVWKMCISWKQRRVCW